MLPACFVSEVGGQDGDDEQQTNGTACGREPSRKGQSLVKVLRKDRNAGQKQQTSAQTNDDALGQHQLPILAAESSCDHSNDHQGASQQHEQPCMTHVIDGSGDNSQGDVEKSLDRADPCNVRVGLGLKKLLLIVRLESALRVA